MSKVKSLRFGKSKSDQEIATHIMNIFIVNERGKKQHKYHSPSNLIFVVAGTCQQAERWAHDAGFKRSSLKHVISAQDLRGAEPTTLHVVGTALNTRPHIAHILDYAKATGWRLYFDNPEDQQ